MLEIKLKENSRTVVVGYNGSSKPLGQRNDLDKLAIIALESNDKSLIELFEKLPTLQELKAEKVNKELPSLADKK